MRVIETTCKCHIGSILGLFYLYTRSLLPLDLGLFHLYTRSLLPLDLGLFHLLGLLYA
jgi:hypothetical protein